MQKLLLVENEFIFSQRHFYISFNLKSKELGIVVYNCTCLGREAKKVFDILWEMGSPNAQLPWKWHFKHATKFNASKPLQVLLNGTMSEVYIAVSIHLSSLIISPEKILHSRVLHQHFVRKVEIQMCQQSSTSLGLLRNLYTLQLRIMLRLTCFPSKSTDIKVFCPLTIKENFLYCPIRTFWPDIDNELKRAAFEKGVNVRLLINYWNHSSPYMFGYLNSLESFSSSCEKGKIEVVRQFVNVNQCLSNLMIDFFRKFLQCPVLMKGRQKSLMLGSTATNTWSLTTLLILVLYDPYFTKINF